MHPRPDVFVPAATRAAIRALPAPPAGATFASSALHQRTSSSHPLPLLPRSDKDAIFAFSSDCAANIVESYVPIIKKARRGGLGKQGGSCWPAGRRACPVACACPARGLLDRRGAHPTPPPRRPCPRPRLQHKTDPYSDRQKQWQQLRRGR